MILHSNYIAVKDITDIMLYFLIPSTAPVDFTADSPHRMNLIDLVQLKDTSFMPAFHRGSVRNLVWGVVLLSHAPAWLLHHSLSVRL